MGKGWWHLFDIYFLASSPRRDYTPCDASVPWSDAKVIISASSVLTMRLPWAGQVLSQKSNSSLVSSAPHARSSSASTAVSMPDAPPKTSSACEKLGIDADTAGVSGVPLSDVPIVKSYPSYEVQKIERVRDVLGMGERYFHIYQ